MNRVAKRAAMAVVAAVGLGASLNAAAVEYPVNFGEPIVLSEQGQPLKVLLPFDGAPNDRATAVAFLVENTEVPEGFRAPVAKNFTVMRPEASPYVIFHSREDVKAPQIVLTVNVTLPDAAEHSRRKQQPHDDGQRRRQREPPRRHGPELVPPCEGACCPDGPATEVTSQPSTQACGHRCRLSATSAATLPSS